ncbi:hypothetical protein HPB50_009573 [Hyalomma asiaticum]|uniref:Uncharacterized protein n=1 Tax=Hyalomma asiaticum TaxID=266040 RepID=A0ACB7RQ49_HYAAI|nr:hypothetical protein HPB50_009573 [Hyalomma asiaticum]
MGPPSCSDLAGFDQLQQCPRSWPDFSTGWEASAARTVAATGSQSYTCALPIASLNRVRDQLTAWGNISKLLKPGGECLLHYGAWYVTPDIWRALARKERWNGFSEMWEKLIPPSQDMRDTDERLNYARSLAKDVGLELRSCEMVGVYIPVQQWSAISCAVSRKEYHPHLCSGYFVGPTPEDPCNYLCYTFEGVFGGVLSDGARCQSGYAHACQYRCISPYGARLIRPYRDGTPCLNLNVDRRPVGAAGVCKAGNCIEYDDMEVRSRWVVENVFQFKYHRCLAKKHLTKNYLWDCHHYCRRNKAWYYGVYEDGSRCLHPDSRMPGWCCHGVCLPTECKRKK